jgi:hypothetical protein
MIRPALEQISLAREARIALLVLLAACGGGGGGGSTNTGPTSPANSATMAAKVGASSWNASVVIAVRGQDGTIAVSGTDNSTFNVGFKVKGTTTGSYPIPDCTGPGGTDKGTNGASVTDFSATKVWGSDCTHTGSVTISAVSSDGVSGTYNFDLAGRAGTAATGPLSVSSGTFTAKF